MCCSNKNYCFWYGYLIFEITFHSLLKCVPGILKSFRSANNTFVTYIAMASVLSISVQIKQMMGKILD
jgi:hypothetical protein